MKTFPRQRPLRLAIAGLGGFAAEHHRAVAALETAGHCCLVCTCDPRASELAGTPDLHRFDSRGVRVFTGYSEMLDTCREQLDYVVVSTPIPLHAPMHAEAVARRIPVYLEKPPTLDPAELETMIATEAGAAAASLIAFNYIVEPTQFALKRRLVEGEFGRIRRASLRAVSPRPTSYYTRAPWAGRARLDGALVLDSCLGNALAHSVHNLLFWTASDAVHAWSAPAEVRAAFYRAHAIEGPDTVFVECLLANGVELRLALSHTGVGKAACEEVVECEHARLVSRPGRSIEVLWTDGRIERHDTTSFDGLAENHLAFQRYLLGKTPRPATTLADSRPFVALNALAWIAAGRVAPLASRPVASNETKAPGGVFLEVEGLDAAQRAFIESEVWPNLDGRNSSRERVAKPDDLRRLSSSLDAFSEASS